MALPGTWATPDERMLQRALRALATSHFARAARDRAAVRTPEAWARRRVELLATLRQLIGPFPERTPLNARVAGRLDKGRYAIEKVLFESRPRFYVTASLYLPRTAGRAEGRCPAVLSPCGHSENGRFYPEYQCLYAALATRGYVVLAPDPLGQGERVQYYDPATGRSRVGNSVSEHTMAGNQCLLLGLHLANYMIWDYIRALDYLCTRPEVDPARIGCAGISGGGMATAYLTPLDERIAAAVPVCWITSMAAKIDVGLMADAEQNLTGQIGHCFDHAELCALVAPRPLRVVAATRDFFPIEGTRQTLAAVRDVYSVLGAPDAVDLAEFDDEHQWSQPLREAAYAWFDRWLMGKTAWPAAEPAVVVEPDETLWASPTGQVADLGGETVASLNRALLPALLPPRPQLATREDVERYQWETRRRIRSVTAVGSGVAEEGVPPVQTLSTEAAGTVYLEHLAFQTDEGITIPATFYLPVGGAPPRSRPAVLCVHEGGCAALGGAAGTPSLLATRGVATLVIDVRGTGQTTPARDPLWGDHALLGSEARLTFDALMLGETLFGMRLRDVLAGLRLLRSRPEIDPGRVGVAGWAAGGLLALTAAALDLQVAATFVTDALLSYGSLVEHEVSAHHGSVYLPGVIAQYDLPDVAAAVAPRPLTVCNPVDHRRERVGADEVCRAYAVATEAYDLLGVRESLTLGVVAAQEAIEWQSRVLKGAYHEVLKGGV